ncbi:hypothetical protein [Microbacterium panaciterrae]|uniref:Calcineurin-like phosphoesterase domain-containing protein n=1 Tax=Microbacterium panaciterrae TaxID=985759 RepID=A0ABP8P3Z2_9MICO
MRITRPPLSTALVVAAIAGASPAVAAEAPGQDKAGHYSFAVIGDVPYGTAQQALFPQWIQEINAAQPEMTFHVGDIKNGSSTCDDALYQQIKGDFDTFRNPLIYMPGDNEWTDCHRTNNGAYNPLERLAYDRSVFFATPNLSLGQNPVKLDSQVAAGFPENVTLRRDGVDFAAIHVVGSNDGTQPWAGLGDTVPRPEQLAAEQSRMVNAIAVVRNTFATAKQKRDRAVTVLLQADMFDPTYTPAWSDISAFQGLVQTLVTESAAFDGEVYLVNGDSHVYNSDKPLSAGSPWLGTYGVTGSADNLTRVTVDGSSNNNDWLRVTINRPGADHVLSWERVPYVAH